MHSRDPDRAIPDRHKGRRTSPSGDAPITARTSGLRAAAMHAPPPTAWADTGPSLQLSATAPAPAASLDQLSQAWKHVRNVVSADARPSDLYDLLSHSVRETQYSFTPQGVRRRRRRRLSAATAAVQLIAGADAAMCMHAACTTHWGRAHATLRLVMSLCASPRRCSPPTRRLPAVLMQWPSLVRPLSPVISEMPAMVLERYNACQVGAGLARVSWSGCGRGGCVRCHWHARRRCLTVRNTLAPGCAPDGGLLRRVPRDQARLGQRGQLPLPVAL